MYYLRECTRVCAFSKNIVFMTGRGVAESRRNKIIVLMQYIKYDFYFSYVSSKRDFIIFIIIIAVVVIIKIWVFRPVYAFYSSRKNKNKRFIRTTTGENKEITRKKRP